MEIRQANVFVNSIGWDNAVLIVEKALHIGMFKFLYIGNVKDATLLEYRREMNMYEVGDHVFMKDPHYTELWIVTNILNDGRIELKTASYGFPVPDRCWGLYYGMADGLIHATDEEINTGKRTNKTIGEA